MTLAFRITLWVIWLALILGAGVALLNYGGQIGVYSGNYGLPSHEWLLTDAARKANRDLWVLIASGFGALVLNYAFVHTSKWGERMGALERGTAAVVGTSLSIVATAYGIQRLVR